MASHICFMFGIVVGIFLCIVVKFIAYHKAQRDVKKHLSNRTRLTNKYNLLLEIAQETLISQWRYVDSGSASKEGVAIYENDLVKIISFIKKRKLSVEICPMFKFDSIEQLREYLIACRSPENYELYKKEMVKNTSIKNV